MSCNRHYEMLSTRSRIPERRSYAGFVRGGFPGTTCATQVREPSRTETDEFIENIHSGDLEILAWAYFCITRKRDLFNTGLLNFGIVF